MDVHAGDVSVVGSLDVLLLLLLLLEVLEGDGATRRIRRRWGCGGASGILVLRVEGATCLDEMEQWR